MCGMCGTPHSKSFDREHQLAEAAQRLAVPSNSNDGKCFQEQAGQQQLLLLLLLLRSRHVMHPSIHPGQSSAPLVVGVGGESAVRPYRESPLFFHLDSGQELPRTSRIGDCTRIRERRLHGSTLLGAVTPSTYWFPSLPPQQCASPRTHMRS